MIQLVGMFFFFYFTSGSVLLFLAFFAFWKISTILHDSGVFLHMLLASAFFSLLFSLPLAFP